MQKTLKQIFLLICITLVLTLPYFVFANPAIKGLEGVRDPSGFAAETNETSLSEILGIMISAVLSLLSVVFIALMLYGGYNWMTASGDTGKLDIAQNTIRRAIIGLVLVVASFSFWKFVEALIFGE